VSNGAVEEIAGNPKANAVAMEELLELHLSIIEGYRLDMTRHFSTI
jgi:hypothetical protein